MLIVGVADMKITSNREETIVTYALGSCLGVAIHDEAAGVGGMLHAMLPSSAVNPDKAAKNPAMFVDTALPLLFKEAIAAGASKKNMKIFVAGGAGTSNFFAIGERNFTILRKMLWKNGLKIVSHDVGGTLARTMHLEVGTGKVWLSSDGKEWLL